MRDAVTESLAGVSKTVSELGDKLVAMPVNQVTALEEARASSAFAQAGATPLASVPPFASCSN